jgi:opacity protein-like surface antigen
MKIKIILAGFIMVMVMPLYAQEKESEKATTEPNKLSLEFDFGISNPLGDYTRYHDPQFGNASMGLYFGLEGIYSLKKNLSISLAFQGNNHQLDLAKQSRYLIENNPTIFEIESTSGQYWAFTTAIGPRIELPVSPNISFTGHVRAGMMVFHTPEIKKQIRGIYLIDQNISSGTSSAFAYQAGLGLTAKATERLTFGLSIEYSGSNQDYTTIITENASAPEIGEPGTYFSTPPGKYTEGHQIQYLNVGLSVIFNLGKR